MWLQPDVQPDYASVVSKALDATSGNNAVNLELFGTQPSFETTNLALYVDYVGSAGKSLDDEAWHLVAATWDGTTKQLFVDGLLRESNASDLLDSDILVEVGADIDAGSPTGFYRGAMDELELYDRALTAEEIGILALHR